jgi:ribosome maturation factor RimP
LALAAGYQTWGVFLLMQADLNRITNLAEQVASSLGLSLVEVRLGQQGRNRTLEVTIYKPGARISLEDCEQVSRQLESLLDQQEPPISILGGGGSYMLEVQSPGTDRKLASTREFELFRGQSVEVKTKQKVDPFGSAFTGKLVGLNEGRVLIEHPEKISDSPKNKKARKPETAQTQDPVSVEMSNVIHVRLLPVIPSEASSHDGQPLED